MMKYFLYKKRKNQLIIDELLWSINREDLKSKDKDHNAHLAQI